VIESANESEKIYFGRKNNNIRQNENNKKRKEGKKDKNTKHYDDHKLNLKKQV
jgi:CRISPR/Cas system Type II protein with McrA/HNH and RuvC-like nuclease domain